MAYHVLDNGGADQPRKRVTVRDLAKMKAQGRKIPTATAYDALTAAIADEAGIMLLLVGDSAGNTVLGYDNTIPVTLEESLMLTAAVRRGAPHAMVVGDMPFMSYQLSPEQALANAGRYLKETGADAVKLEGGRLMNPTIRRLVDAGIPVFAHIGLLPQSVLRDGGYRLHGKSDDEARQLLDDALAIQEAGAFAVVLEGIPAELSRQITASLDIPTIGIGAGPHTDGQIQVTPDILGLSTGFLPRHAKRFANLADTMRDAFKAYIDQIQDGSFPGPENYR